MEGFEAFDFDNGSGQNYKTKGIDKFLSAEASMRFVLGLAILVSTIPAWADVDLEFFEAIPGFEQVLLRWETASEADCDYFLLGGDLGFSAEIAAMNSAEGAAYEYLHQGLEGWNPYAYTLFAVAFNGDYQFLGEAYAMPTGDGCYVELLGYDAAANNEQ
ncbi:hypothetical protein KKG66_06845, partial [bacterium]|nr:hypothetical protein [bacterium]